MLVPVSDVLPNLPLAGDGLPRPRAMAGLSRHQERPDIGKIENRAPSIARMFLDRVAATPNAEAFRFRPRRVDERHLATGRRPGRG